MCRGLSNSYSASLLRINKRLRIRVLRKYNRTLKKEGGKKATWKTKDYAFRRKLQKRLSLMTPEKQKAFIHEKENGGPKKKKLSKRW